MARAGGAAVTAVPRARRESRGAARGLSLRELSTRDRTHAPAASAPGRRGLADCRRPGAKVRPPRARFRISRLHRAAARSGVRRCTPGALHLRASACRGADARPRRPRRAGRDRSPACARRSCPLVHVSGRRHALPAPESRQHTDAASSASPVNPRARRASTARLPPSRASAAALPTPLEEATRLGDALGGRLPLSAHPRQARRPHRPGRRRQQGAQARVPARRRPGAPAPPP